MESTNPQINESEVEIKIEELRKERESGKSHFICYLKALDIFVDLCNGNPEESKIDSKIIKSLSRELAFNLRMELEYFVNSIVDERVKEKWKELIKKLKESHSQC
ncbi:MAG: hypothetical protein ACE5KZ_08755 [Candidatus Scalinduaceae bacterium]